MLLISNIITIVIVIQVTMSIIISNSNSRGRAGFVSLGFDLELGNSVVGLDFGVF